MHLDNLVNSYLHPSQHPTLRHLTALATTNNPEAHMETTKFPASPGTPLFPLSPERVNGAKLPHNGKSMQSPHAAMPEFGKPSLTVDPFLLTSKSPKSPFRHSRHNSDALVQSMIARFDHMTVKDYRANHENAIKRVEIAREMAEIESKQLKEELAHKDEDTRKVKEEARKLKRELEDAKDRERKVSRRLDVLMVSFRPREYVYPIFNQSTGRITPCQRYA